MTSLKDRNKIKNDLKTGEVNIIIGTHALLSNDVDFNNLGLADIVLINGDAGVELTSPKQKKIHLIHHYNLSMKKN